MAIPLSLSLLLLNGIFKNKFTKGLLMSISVFTLSFLFIISPVANIDNRLFSTNRVVRRAFTESELQSLDTISEIWNGKVGVDLFFAKPFQFKLNYELIYLDHLLDASDFSDLQDTLIIVRARANTLKLKYNLYFELDNQNFSHIYDCGSINGYLQP